MNKQVNELKEKYGESAQGNFFIVDTMPIHHHYMITHKHVIYAANHYNGILNKEAIIEAENTGNAKCGVRNCHLSYTQHESALLVCCKKDFHTDENSKNELQDWLTAINPKVESDGYVGYAFIQYNAWAKSNAEDTEEMEG